MQRTFSHYVGRYLLILIAGCVVVIVLTGLAYSFAPDFAARIFDGGGRAGISLAALMVPAMLLAQHFLRSEGRAMRNAEAWRYTGVFTLLVIALNVIVLVMVARVTMQGLSFPDMMVELLARLQTLGAEVSSQIFAAVYLASVVFASRLGLWVGFRTAANG